MEEPSNEERESECHYFRSEDDRENESGKMGWVLDKGLGLGKKILFTTFVISSAPLTLPPLVVFSAIGFVVSIPSGIFLATYVCSEKLMSKLLPIPVEEEDMAEEEEEEEEVHRGMKTKNEIDEIGEEKTRERVVVPLEARKEPVVAEEEIVVEVSEEKREPEEIVEVDSMVVQDEKQNGADEKTTTENDNNNKTGQTPQEISTSSKGDEQTIAKTTPTELPVSEGPQEPKDAPEISSAKPVQTTPSSTNEVKKKKNLKKKPTTSQQQAPPPPPSSESKVEFDEKKIWEQIEAVRKIVGYKVTAQTTSVEELKALFVFTGVQPPASFKEPSDLAEVNNKLQFLKSIIGVN